MVTLNTLRRRVRDHMARDAEAASSNPSVHPAAAVPQSHGTFESRVDSRLRDFVDPTSPEAAEYLLAAMPFIHEYHVERASTPDRPELLAGFVTVTSTSNRGDVLQRYLAEVEKDPVGVVERARCRGSDEFVCERCDQALASNAHENVLVCERCGLVRTQGLDGAELSFHEQQTQTKVVKYCNYKRSNHFSEWINALMGRESTVIPDDVLDKVRAEFKKARITNTADITPTAVRAFLRKLKLNKWYEHTHSICGALNGVSPPVMSQDLEQRLKDMFDEIQEPWHKHYKSVVPERKNMMSYSYCLYKFCELLGHDEYLPYLTLLKCQEKLYKMDCIWRKICDDLQWQFIPTV